MEDVVNTLMKRVKSLSNNELIEMITTQAKDYTTEAINIAKEEIIQRGGLDKIKAKIEDEKIKEIERIKSLPNNELMEMIATKYKDYTSEDLNVAKEEINLRGGFDSIKKQLDDERRKQNEMIKKQKLEEENNIRKRIEETKKYINQNQTITKVEGVKKVIFAFIGAILGIPLSYYFQSSMVQNKVGGIGGYFKHFDEIIKDENLVGNVILSVIIFALIGGLIGYFIDKIEVKN